jgi:glyceraldehyde 3-phosphate dehydrogenase
VLRAIVESGRTDIDVVAINDLGPVETNAHLLRYDSVHGRFPGTVTTSADTIDAGRGPMRVTAERDPTKLPWGDVDVALECTGIFTDGEKAALHLPERLQARARLRPRVGQEWKHDRELKTVVFGVNDESLDAEDHVVSNASCTTNCLAPGGLRAQRGGGDRARLHDHDPQLHGRPADARHHAQGPLPRPRGGAVDDPDLDGAAKAVGKVLPEPQRQARRRGDPGAHAQRLGGGLQVRGQRETSVEEINERDKGARSRRLRASSASPRRSWSRRTSTTTRIPRSSTWTRPR